MSYVSDMDVFLAKLLRKRLTESPQAKLAGRERARNHIATDTRRRAGEDERPPAPMPVQRVLTQGEHDLARERERGLDVHLERRVDVRFGDVEEGTEDIHAGVPERDAQLGLPRGGPRVARDRVEHF